MNRNSFGVSFCHRLLKLMDFRDTISENLLEDQHTQDDGGSQTPCRSSTGPRILAKAMGIDASDPGAVAAVLGEVEKQTHELPCATRICVCVLADSEAEKNRDAVVRIRHTFEKLAKDSHQASRN